MNKSKLLWLSLPLLVLVPMIRSTVRSVLPLGDTNRLISTRFDPAQSTALFVGIRKFTQDRSLTEVHYAADDAVDLAYTFAMSPNEAMVRPERVVVALSGSPYKQKSKDRLNALRAAGAEVVMDVDQDELLRLIKKQSARAGLDGMLIISFATHGFATDGVQYLLGAASSFKSVSTTLSTAEIADIAASSKARRSLLLFDACRERVDADARSVLPDADSAAPLITEMAGVEGQVIFHAATHGGYAYDDPARGNGVFTAAVIDSLQCAPGQRSEVLTVEVFAKRVEKRVLAYLKRRDPSVRKATQLSTEGATPRMPLAQCRPTPLGSPRPVVTAMGSDTAVEAFAADGRLLWRHELSGQIRSTFVEQLFRKKTPYVVVLSDDERGAISHVTIYDNSGNVFATYSHDGPLRRMIIEKPTSKHIPRIVVTGIRHNAPTQRDIPGPFSTTTLLEPKSSGSLNEIWCGALLDPRETITSLHTAGDKRRREIVLSTSAGSTIRLDFRGGVIDIDSRPGVATQFRVIAGQ